MSTGSPEGALAAARATQVYGSLTVHLAGGVPTFWALRTTQRPSGDPHTAALVARHQAVREALQAGDDAELVFVRLRGGRLIHLATEIHRETGEHPHAAAQPRDD